MEPGFILPNGPLTLDFHGGHLVTVTESGGNLRLVFDQDVSNCGYAGSARDFAYNPTSRPVPTAAAPSS